MWLSLRGLGEILLHRTVFLGRLAVAVILNKTFPWGLFWPLWVHTSQWLVQVLWEGRGSSLQNVLVNSYPPRHSHWWSCSRQTWKQNNILENKIRFPKFFFSLVKPKVWFSITIVEADFFFLEYKHTSWEGGTLLHGVDFFYSYFIELFYYVSDFGPSPCALKNLLAQDQSLLCTCSHEAHIWGDTFFFNIQQVLLSYVFYTY